MNDMTSSRICQIALSIEDKEASRDFYENTLGMRYANWTDGFKGKTAEMVQGVPGVSSECVWMIDDREMMQVELFKFLTPETRPAAKTRKPWDIGYSRVAFEVNDVKAFHRKCLNSGVDSLGPICTVDGENYFAMKDPTGILLEIGRAKQKLPNWLGARPCGIALTVPDLDAAMKSFHDTIGFGKISGKPADKGVLWDEKESDKQTVLLDGGTLWVELSQYTTPSSAPWPDGYRITDLGVVNIAVGYRDFQGVKDLYERTLKAGFTPNCEPQGSSLGGCTYVNDPRGFSFEIMAVKKIMDGAFGFKPANRFDRILGWIITKLT